MLDQRGAIDAEAPPVLYLPYKESQKFSEGRPRFPVIHWLRATRTEGDGVIEDNDRLQNWDTQSAPDGVYEVTVRAWDLKGNPASRTAKVRVANGPHTPKQPAAKG